ncbi:hypothetical protein [Mesorhizobium sp. KR1-2]|uniref:hypothetical protein n=1 Tax=Mesorhizobium sp. KR1-2 TaxID=3156609 RepID=UPI0032B4CE02
MQRDTTTKAPRGRPAGSTSHNGTGRPRGRPKGKVEVVAPIEQRMADAIVIRRCDLDVDPVTRLLRHAGFRLQDIAHHADEAIRIAAERRRAAAERLLAITGG